VRAWWFLVFRGIFTARGEVVVWACVFSKLRCFSLRWISLCDGMDAMQKF